MMRILIAGRGHLLGWEDLSNDRNHTTSVRCMSNSGQVLIIDGESFSQFVESEPEMFKKFSNLSKNRDAVTINQIKSTRR